MSMVKGAWLVVEAVEHEAARTLLVAPDPLTSKPGVPTLAGAQAPLRRMVRLLMRGRGDSLNTAVAARVLLYAIAARREDAPARARSAAAQGGRPP